MSNTNRYIYTQIREYKKDIKENDKILYIVGSKVNLEYLTSMINYEIMPIKLDKAMKANFDDIDDFKNNVKKYEYVFIYQIENEQKEKIKDVFENKKIETSALYRVKNEDNKIELNLMTGFGDVL